MDYLSLGATFADVARRFGDRPAWRIRRGDDWETTTYATAADRIARLATALVDAGLRPRDRVAIFAPNRPEWTLVDLAAITAGGIVVPLYANSTAEQVRHLLADSGASWVFAAGAREAGLVAEVRDSLPALEQVVVLDPVDGLETLGGLEARPPSSWAVTEVGERLAGQAPGDACTIVYTSGTTGEPRGAMLSHTAIRHEGQVIIEGFGIDETDQNIAFLPLAHALERACTMMMLSVGALVTYCPNPLGVAELLPIARPTLLLSVPKFYEKIVTAVHAQAGGSAVRKRILGWALAVGARAASARRAGRAPSTATTAQLPLARRLVLDRLIEAIGGPKKLMAAGGAPLRVELEEFFQAAGQLLGQGYGLTEAGPLITLYTPTTHRLGSVGYVIPGGELRLEDSGELCYRGPNVMLGYWHNPDATAEAIDADGWLHTGDVATIDADGYVYITDRLKDIIINSGGKNVAPQPIEALLIGSGLFDEAVVVGNDRPFLTLVAQASPARLAELSTGRGVDEVAAAFRERAAACTAQLPPQERIRDVLLVDGAFDPGSDLVTPTLKVRRRAVERRYAAEIDAMYARARARHEASGGGVG